MNELHWWTAYGLADAIRGREVSAREALEHFVNRVEQLDGPINAVVRLDLDRARADAAEADAAIARGDELGPLHGVPITVKDSYMTEGCITTSGAPELADFVPTEDAWPVARLRAAGAIIYGKTNLPIFAGDIQSYNEVYGTTNNPHDVSRTAGGSSGGSAAALAMGFTPIELGSGCPRTTPGSRGTSRATGSCRRTARSPGCRAPSPRPTSPSPVRWPARRATWR
jgi:amidase